MLLLSCTSARSMVESPVSLKLRIINLTRLGQQRDKNIPRGT